MALPAWLKVKAVPYEKQAYMGRLLEESNINTVCESAACPNIGECFSNKTATFLILGDVCTRNCCFCAIQKGIPNTLDHNEPKRIAKAIKKLDLLYVVITSVTRDDLKDKGANFFAQTVKEVKNLNANTIVEILIPDLQGSRNGLDIVITSKPEVISHNIETVPRLYPSIRSKAGYDYSLNLLRMVKYNNLSIKTKTGIMLGLGESDMEVMSTMKDISKTGCDFLTIGQYLAPTNNHTPVKRYVHPERFEWFRKEALNMGFLYVASAPLVRSSYLAREAFYDCKNI